jgi:RNA polymerase sigma-70 factor (ECF subfamily)
MTSAEQTPDELEKLLEEAHEEGFGWALHCCGWNHADAEDVLQATYLKVISGRARFEGRSAFRTWLFGVIRMTAREQRRRARSLDERAEGFAREHAAVGAGVVEGPDREVERQEHARALTAALATLPDKQREVLHLVFYQGLTVREAAEVMEVSLGTARVHYHRGKEKLRGLLAESEKGGGSR